MQKIKDNLYKIRELKHNAAEQRNKVKADQMLSDLAKQTKIKEIDRELMQALAILSTDTQQAITDFETATRAKAPAFDTFNPEFLNAVNIIKTYGKDLPEASQTQIAAKFRNNRSALEALRPLCKENALTYCEMEIGSYLSEIRSADIAPLLDTVYYDCITAEERPTTDPERVGAQLENFISSLGIE